MYQLAVSPLAFLRVKVKMAFPRFMRALRPIKSPPRELAIRSKALEDGKASMRQKDSACHALETGSLDKQLDYTVSDRHVCGDGELTNALVTDVVKKELRQLGLLWTIERVLVELPHTVLSSSV
jgi:hypothetical protein